MTRSSPRPATLPLPLIQTPEEVEALAERINRPFEELDREISALHEINPMLGLRGCRLSIRHPEISIMQASHQRPISTLRRRPGAVPGG